MILFPICLAIALTPVLAVQHPPLLDYPNHLARLFILTSPDNQVLAEYYQPSWSLLPNLGFDIVGYLLVQIMPLEVAGRVFLAVSIAVVLSAPCALHRVLYGQLSPLPLLAGALLFNRVLQMGFLSYFLGVGLAVWAFAIWLMRRRASTLEQIAWLQAAVLVIFVCHLYAAAVLGVLVITSAASEGWHAAPASASRIKHATRRALPLLLPFVTPALILVLASSTRGAAGGIEYEDYYLKLLKLPAALMLEVTLQGLALTALALVPVVVLRFRPKRVLHPLVTWALAAMLTLFFVMPDELMSSENADWRLLFPATLVLLGAAVPYLGRYGVAKAAVLALAVNVAAAGNAWATWWEGDRIFAEFSTVMNELPHGELLIPYFPEGLKNFGVIEGSFLIHVASYAVIAKSAMVPTIFASPGHQPIAVTERYTDASGWFQGLHADSTQPKNALPLARQAYILKVVRKTQRSKSIPPPPVAAKEVFRTKHFVLYDRPGASTDTKAP